jgi:hypothetical protein
MIEIKVQCSNPVEASTIKGRFHLALMGDKGYKDSYVGLSDGDDESSFYFWVGEDKGSNNYSTVLGRLRTK